MTLQWTSLWGFSMLSLYCVYLWWKISVLAFMSIFKPIIHHKIIYHLCLFLQINSYYGVTSTRVPSWGVCSLRHHPDPWAMGSHNCHFRETALPNRTSTLNSTGDFLTLVVHIQELPAAFPDLVNLLFLFVLNIIKQTVDDIFAKQKRYTSCDHFSKKGPRKIQGSF